MKRLLAILICCAGLVHAQAALPEFLKFSDVEGLKLAWVDFGWSEEAFTAMETGARHPAAGREWMLGLLRIQQDPIRFEGNVAGVGTNLFVLVPKSGDKPMRIELRGIDFRQLLIEPNVIGTPPAKYDLIASVPARFETVPEVAERLDMKLSKVGRDTKVTIHYGNRQTELMLRAREQ
jgi:hypothetical protein